MAIWLHGDNLEEIYKVMTLLFYIIVLCIAKTDYLPIKMNFPLCIWKKVNYEVSDLLSSTFLSNVKGIEHGDG